jgi:hypothetical protein
MTEPKPRYRTARVKLPKTSPLETEFDFQCQLQGLEPVKEFRAIPGRMFRFDRAFPKMMLLIELQGGTFSSGAHGRGYGIHRDYSKNNLAVKAGYRVLYYDSPMVRSGEAVNDLIDTLNRLSNGGVK